MSIKVALHHQTIYRFARSIFLGPHLVRLRPTAHCQTPIQSYSFTVENVAYGIRWQQDVSGNFIARLTFSTPTAEVKIKVDLIAEIKPVNPFDFFLEGYAERYPFRYEETLLNELEPFLKIQESGALLKAWLKTIDQTPSYTTNFVVGLNQQLQQAIAHSVRLDPGIQSCEETLSKKIGSCRDTAWLLVQIFRHCGLAARFVSGYLIQLAPDIKPLDGPSGPEEDTADLHAWVEVYLPGGGWIGLDPTSGLLAAENHIPLACTADPINAAPITGTHEPCPSELEFAFSVARFAELPRITKPYTKQQWQEIDALGKAVDEQLTTADVGLTIGGEPTFVSIDDFESPEWRTAALGEDKLKLAKILWERLRDRFAVGGLLLDGLGKSYPGETIQRWALGCYWRKDGIPIWSSPALLRNSDDDLEKNTESDARVFIHTLVSFLGIPESYIIPAYEMRSQTVAGYVLPLLRVNHNGEFTWATCLWEFSGDRFVLLPGETSLGWRLPLASINWNLDNLAIETMDEPIQDVLQPNAIASLPANMIRVALSVEVKDQELRIFIPPIRAIAAYLQLIAWIEKTASQTNLRVKIEGYPPPRDRCIQGFQITPDPGVIEVNIHPAESWQNWVKTLTILYEEARQCRLGTHKHLMDGRLIGTGGGSHITIGGMTPAESPLLKRPDLLQSLITYWQHHPGLSYLFSGLFVGPTSQAPRIDEARHESLYELEIAFAQLQQRNAIAPEFCDRLFRNLLVDMTGNTHRSEFCIDKLYPVENLYHQLGLLEFRGLEMPPHPQMALVQALLIRTFIAWFWQHPYTRPLIRWGTTLHDRFMLPHYIELDLRAVIAELQAAGYGFNFEWLLPFFEFRFPLYGSIEKEGIHLELRPGIEPWHVLGEEMNHGTTARYVDSSLERIQVKLQGAIASRYVVLCNDRRVPLQPTNVAGEFVAGVRFRARSLGASLHPAIAPHVPLRFEIIDTFTGRSVGGCTYYADHPNQVEYNTFPINEREAQSRVSARFVPMGHQSGIISVPPLEENLEYPITLDLRRS